MTKTQPTTTGQERKPANAAAAMRAIDRVARERYGLDAPEALEAAGGPLDGRLTPEQFRAEISADPEEACEAEQPADEGRVRKVERLKELIARAPRAPAWTS